ncbi:MAG: response regulator [Desulfuromonadales bacterium]|nr:response regulator [Desulfuromonadales bacterium]
MNNINTNMKNILIIEDDLAIQGLLRQVLKPHNVSIEFASSGPEGLDNYQKKDYCLVVTDINLPGFDGNCVARYIKEKTPSMPIIGISGLPFQDATNFCQTLVKPFNVKQFADTVLSLSEPKHTCLKRELHCPNNLEHSECS